MKDDTISRQAAIAYSISGMTREIDGDKWIRVSEVRESIKTMPSTQQDIIRCKDCGHADWSGLPDGMLYCMVHEHYLSEDDYCSYGVKEDGRHDL